MYKAIRIAIFMSVLGVLILALPLSIRSQKDLHEALALLAGIEIPLIVMALQECFYRHLRQRIIPMHFGNVNKDLIFPPINSERK